MKPLRVLSPIEPGELCWVRVDGEWWLVRAEKFDCCQSCALHDFPCVGIACGMTDGINVQFTRVHPIPMPAEVKVGDVIQDEEHILLVIRGDCDGCFYMTTQLTCGDLPWASQCDDDGEIAFTRIGPPEE